ncbi:MAG: DUF6483 family protein [Firmicutes bacterium]|nr:DUF6483 family protein [Bacillota bacterium]
MYFQRDYVLRMIEMAGELVRRICSVAREADARQELDEICQKASGMPMAMLRTENPDTLVDLLSEAQRYLSAELLLIDMAISRRKKTEDELLPVREQALMLLSSLEDPDYALPACGEVKRLLEGVLDQLSVEPLLRSAGLLERCGEYADAEDVLFAALSSSAEDRSPEVRAEAEAFYARLEALDEKTLLEGNFSRAEIAEGREALRADGG